MRRHDGRFAILALAVTAALAPSVGHADDGQDSDPVSQGGATTSVRAPGFFINARLVPAQGNGEDPIYMEFGPAPGEKSGKRGEFEITERGRVSVSSSSTDPSTTAGAMAATALLAMTGRVTDPEKFVTGQTGVPVHLTIGDPVPGVSEEMAAFLARFLSNLVLADAGSGAQLVFERVLSTVTPPPANGSGGFDASCCPLDVVAQPPVDGQFQQYLVQNVSTSPPTPVPAVRVTVCGGSNSLEPGIVPCYGTITDANGLATFDGHQGPLPPFGLFPQKLTVTLDPQDQGPVCQPPVSLLRGLEIQQTSQASTCGAPPGSPPSGTTFHNVLGPGALIQNIGPQTFVCTPPSQNDCGLYAIASASDGGSEQVTVYTDAGASAGPEIEVDVCTQGFDTFGNAFPQPTCGFAAYTNVNGVAVFDGQGSAQIPSGTQLSSVVVQYQGQACTPPVTVTVVTPPPLF